MKEKKEIGKLIELLNEFENRDDDQQIEWRIGEGDKGEKGKVRGVVNEVYMGWVSELVVCSAYYGFIKWLVENDKIDIVKVYENLTNYEIEIRIRAVKELLENNEEDTIAYLKLLMILAIQDEPIRFLCEIIK